MTPEKASQVDARTDTGLAARILNAVSGRRRQERSDSDTVLGHQASAAEKCSGSGRTATEERATGTRLAGATDAARGQRPL
jgi:hypothetical protein